MPTSPGGLIQRCHPHLRQLLQSTPQSWQGRLCALELLRRTNAFSLFLATGRIWQAIAIARASPMANGISLEGDLDPMLLSKGALMTIDGITSTLCHRVLTPIEISMLRGLGMCYTTDWQAWNRLVCRISMGFGSNSGSTSSLLLTSTLTSNSTSILSSDASSPGRESLLVPRACISTAAANLRALAPHTSDSVFGLHALSFLSQGHPQTRGWGVRALLFEMGALSRLNLSALEPTRCDMILACAAGPVDETHRSHLGALWTLWSWSRSKHHVDAPRSRQALPLHAAHCVAFRMQQPSALEDCLSAMPPGVAQSFVNTPAVTLAISESAAAMFKTYEHSCQTVLIMLRGMLKAMDDAKFVKTSSKQNNWSNSNINNNANGIISVNIQDNDAILSWFRIIFMLSGRLVHNDEYTVLRNIVCIAFLLQRLGLRSYTSLFLSHANHLAASLRGWNTSVSSSILRILIYDIWRVYLSC